MIWNHFGRRAVPLGLMLGCLIGLAAVPDVPIAVAQPPAKGPDKTHGRGRVKPKNLEGLKAKSHARNADRLARLPKATQPAYDATAMMGPVKDQGQCGSCWDFSGTGVVEGAYGKVGVKVVLSEQFTLDCGSNGGCGGDDNTSVLQDAKRGGLPVSSDYGSYHASEGKCKDSSTLKKYPLADWGFCDGSGQGVTATQKIKDAMFAYGPIGCAVDAGFDDPGTGVISGRGHNIDHDVMLCGWDDAKGSKGAWRMRNSWGTGWADGGYAWIEFGAFDIGTEAVFAIAPGTPTPVPPDPTPVPPGPPAPPEPPAPAPWWTWLHTLIAAILAALGFAAGHWTGRAARR